MRAASAKRIIPILRRRIYFGDGPAPKPRFFAWASRAAPQTKAPPGLAALNVKITFLEDGEKEFTAALDQLCAALDVDVAWHRENRRLTELSLKWDAAGRQADSLMRPADIKAAECLLERRPRSAEPPPAVLGDYLDASRARVEEETRRLRRIIGRAFVKPARQALTDGPGESALRLVAAGALLADDLDLKLVDGLWSPAPQAIYESPARAVLKGHEASVRSASFSPDGRRIVTASEDKTARLWDASSGSLIASPEGHEDEVLSACVQPGRRPDRDRVLRQDGAAVGREHRRLIASLQGHEDAVLSASFSPDGGRIVTASADNTARLWDARSGSLIAVLGRP